MKYFSLSLIIFAFLITGGITLAAVSKSDIPSSYVYQAVSKYRQKNYTGCIQDMNYLIEQGKPTDVAYYYKALSYAQLGMKDEARESYKNAMKISGNRSLIDYSKQAVACIDDPATCDSNLQDADITKFIKSDEFMHADVKEALQTKTVEKAKAVINDGKKPSEDDLKYLNMETNEPTDKEIADAVRTFAKLGISPFNSSSSMYGAQNSELAQMNAFLGNQNNNQNSMMNLIPMVSAMQSSSDNKSGMNKELIEAMMLNQMLPGLNFSNSDK